MYSSKQTDFMLEMTFRPVGLYQACVLTVKLAHMLDKGAVGKKSRQAQQLSVCLKAYLFVVQI